MTSRPPNRTAERGSVFYIILIAVALFAALMFTFTRSARQGGSSLSGKQAELAATSILSDAQNFQTMIQRVTDRGVSESSLSFETPQSPAYANADCTDETCRIFAGGRRYPAPDGSWLDASQSARPWYGKWWFTGETCVYLVGTGGNDCFQQPDSAMDLVVILPWVRRDICLRINSDLGVENRNGNPPKINNQAFSTTMPAFTGSFTPSGHAIQSDGTNRSILQRKLQGCAEGAVWPPAGTYFFYSVLLPR